MVKKILLWWKPRRERPKIDLLWMKIEFFST